MILINMKKAITIGSILSLIGSIALIFWLLSLSSDIISNPTNPTNVGNVANKTIEEATPPQANIIMALAPYGVIGAILIFIILYFWKKIMDYKIPLNY